MNQKNLSTHEQHVIEAWAKRDLDKRIQHGDPVVHPERWLDWRIREITKRALDDPTVRNQLHRLAEAWGVDRTSTAAYSAPVEDVPHPKATPDQIARWVAQQRVLLRLPMEHWLRLHIIERLMEERRPPIEERTEADEIRADAEALEVLAELEALIEQNHAEVVSVMRSKPATVLQEMP